MSAWWFAPLALTALMLAWYGVQRAWLRCMARPAGDDALARSGCTGPDGRGCACDLDTTQPAAAVRRHPIEVSPS